MTGRSSTISYAAMVNKNVAKSEESSLITVPNQTQNNKKPPRVEQPKEEFPQLNKTEEQIDIAGISPVPAQPKQVVESKQSTQEVVTTAAPAEEVDDNNGEFIEKKKREKKDPKQRNNNSSRSNNRRQPLSGKPQRPANQKKANEITAQTGANSISPAATTALASQPPRRDSSEVTKTFGEKFDEEKAKYLERFKDVKDEYCFKLVKGDLFTADENVSLAHCVSEDFIMSKGIATEFKKRFGNVDALLEQKTRTGGCAFIKNNNRYLFYLVTKKFNSHKPYYNSIEKSLKEMRSLCKKMQIKDLAMPMIGTGLDRLDWKIVGAIIDFVFKKENINITIYKFEKNRQGSNSKTPNVNNNSSNNQASSSTSSN